MKRGGKMHLMGWGDDHATTDSQFGTKNLESRFCIAEGCEPAVGTRRIRISFCRRGSKGFCRFFCSSPGGIALRARTSLPW